MELLIFYDRQEFLLDHDFIAKIEERNGGDSKRSYKEDLEKGMLNGYRGTFVAYQKGTFCGQSSDERLLINEGTDYYGASNLEIFHVPIKRNYSLGIQNE